MSEPKPENPALVPARERRRVALRVVVLAVIVALLGAGILNVDLQPNLSHVEIGILGGAEGGHYDEIVAGLARRARHERGSVRNLRSAGSMENLSRLLDDERCEADFALVQDGLGWHEVGRAAYDDIELVARLPQPEALLFVGPGADAIADFGDLRGMTIGAGPEGSGTAVVLRRLFELPSFESLGATLVHGPVAEQVEATRDGTLDVAAMVVFPDAEVVTRAARRRGLSVASFRSAEAVARHLDGARAGVLPAGHFDAVRQLPASPRQILTLDTLVVAGPCASRSEINAVLTLLSHEQPGFVAHNRELAPPVHVTQSDVAREFYDNHGPPMVDRYLPRVVDVVPLSNVMTLIMAISVLFNVMSFLNRFRLWRLDGKRHKMEDELKELFGGSITRKEIGNLDPTEVLTDEAGRQRLADVIARLNVLLGLCRGYATSFLVPMGQEMVYRYQENLILELIAVLRQFQRRQAAAARGEDWTDL